MGTKHILVGKTITAIHLAADREALRFDVAEGEPIIARCDGDCCSVTWIEGIEGAEDVLGSPVLSVTDLDMPDLGSVGTVHRPDVDSVAYYGCKISTARGEMVIDYRNDSNGYYGGSLSWPDDRYYYGGVYGQNVSREEWMPLTAPASPAAK